MLWYFTHLSLVNVVYGSLTGVVIALLTLEAASVILLLGAQVIAEYERLLPEFGGDRRESTTRQAGEISGQP